MAKMLAKIVVLVMLVSALEGALAQQKFKSYLDALKANPSHKMMVQLLNKAPKHITGMLATGQIGLTIFAPTDAAFRNAMKRYGVSTDAAMANNNLLQNVLMYHVVPGLVPLSKLTPGTRLTTMQADTAVSTTGKKTMLRLRVAHNVDSKTGKTKVYIQGRGSNGLVTKPDQIVLSRLNRDMGVIHDIANVLLPVSQAEAAKLVGQLS